MNCVELRWEKGERYYEAHFQEDLYGLVVIRVWGRKKTRIGRSMRTRVESQEEGLEVIEQIKKRRKYRGYEVV